MKSILLSMFLVLSQLGIAQVEVDFDRFNFQRKNFIYLKAGFYELALGYEHKLDTVQGLGLEIDYRPRFRDASRRKIKQSLVNGAYESFRIKGTLNFYNRWVEDFISIVGSYRYLESGKITVDDTHFSGCNNCDGEHSKYTEFVNEVGLTAIFHTPVHQSSYFSWYLGAGVLYRFNNRHYTMFGLTYTTMEPVNFTRKFAEVWPNLTFGIKMHFPHFGAKYK